MVFGWGKKKQEESVEQAPQDKEITLEDVPKALSDLGALRKSQTLAEITSLRNSTAPLIDDLIRIGRVLEEDDLKIDNIDKHLAIIVVRGKKQVIDVIKKGAVPLPEISSVDDANKLNTTLNQILKKIGDVLGRQTRVIHIFAKKYAAQLKGNLEVMHSNHAEIRKLLKNFESTKSLSDEIHETLDEISNSTQLRRQKLQKISNADESISALKEKISSTTGSIEKTKASESYKKYLNLKNKFDEFTNIKSKIKDQINIQFTKLSRPLSKYEYAFSLEKEQKEILSRLIAEPFGVLTPENKDSVIVILENIRKAISSGSISVKDVEKTSSQITETEEALDEFVSQVSEYHKTYKEMQHNVDSLLPSDLLSLECALAKDVTRLEELHLKSETLHGEVDEIDTKIPQLTSDIEQKLRQFSNTHYTIIPSS